VLHYVIHKIPNSVVCILLSFLAVFCDLFGVMVYGTQENLFFAYVRQTGGCTNTNPDRVQFCFV
jgi:hypothetical protein